ncbi:MAG: DedA family protein [Desulfuromonadaceae bacterium]|jgi:membrane protein DedA with SNARE-associated domain
MYEWIQHTLPQFHPGMVYYLILCGLILAEGIPVIGLFVPGSVLSVTAGALAFHGHGEMPYICLVSAVGSIAGDSISYICGSRSASWLISKVRKGRFLRFLRRAEVFFGAHGGKSLLLARFIGPIRGFVPFVAGGAHMHPRSFCVYTFCGGVSWGIIYPSAGYLGLKTVTMKNISTHSLILAGLCIILIILIYLKVKRSES